MMSNNALFLSLRLVAVVNGWRWDEEIHYGENWRLGDTAQKSTYSVSGISEIFTETHYVSGISEIFTETHSVSGISENFTETLTSEPNWTCV